MKIEYTSSENDKHVGRKYIQQGYRLSSFIQVNCATVKNGIDRIDGIYDRADVKIMYSNKISLTAISAYELKLSESHFN